MKNKIVKEVRRKIINVITEINDRPLLESEKDRILNTSDDKFFEFVFDELSINRRKDMDEVMLLYMKLNMYLSQISYEIYVKGLGPMTGDYVYEYREKVNKKDESNIAFFVDRNIGKYPAFSLRSDNWDDYGYKTTFAMRYYDEKGYFIDIGDIKILNANNRVTKNIIPTMFMELSNDYYSLGQSIDFYTKLSFHVPNYENVLKSLNDIAFNKTEDIEDNAPIQNSLLRFSEARKAYIEAFVKEITKNNFSFNYEFSHMNYGQNQMPSPINIEFNFDKDEILPYRINSIIGKNGVRKNSNNKKLVRRD